MRGTRAAFLTHAAAAAGLLTFSAIGGARVAGQQQPPPDTFRFRSGIDLVNVDATVTDRQGRFVSGLQKSDFTVYEDGVPQTITHFSNERVPVSLGIALDTSRSMAGEKLDAARDALDRFLDDLGDPSDEFFLYRFSNFPVLVERWTRDRELLRRALGRIGADGATALYDTVGDAVPLVRTGTQRKKALVIISDGNDTTSRTPLTDVKQLIRQSEVLVYAVGINGPEEPAWEGRPPRLPIPLPFPPRGRGGWPPSRPTPPPVRRGSWDNAVNATALRELTDDSGGRTEIIRNTRDLDPAVRGIADELSKQYYLGYPSSGTKDGRWHSIRVELRNRTYRVRARKGYVAS